MRRAFIIGSFAFFAAAFGQVRPADDSSGTVSILTTPAGADVYVDSMFLGKSPVRSIPVKQGRHMVRAYYPSVFSWKSLSVVDSIDVAQGRSLKKHVLMGTVLRVQADPPGSTVTLGGALAGTAPLYLQSPEILHEDILISKLGYDTLVIPFGELSRSFIHVRLHPRPGSLRDLSAGGIVSSTPTTDHWLTYASGATMIASGVVSAYLKDRANRAFDSYMITKDAGGLSATRRLDTGAAAALAVSQISFAILAYILLSE